MNSYGKVIVSTDNAASYAISDIQLENDKINSPELATFLKINKKENLPFYTIKFNDMVSNLLTKKIQLGILVSQLIPSR